MRWRWMGFVSMCLLALMSFAMPSEEAIGKAETLVRELAESDFNAVKEGKKTRKELAASLVAYVADSETEAGKYVLLRAAFRQYMVDGNVSEALSAYRDMKDVVKGVPDGTFEAWAGPSVTRFIKKGQPDKLAALVSFAVEVGETESAAALAKVIRPALPRLKKGKGGVALADALARATELDDTRRQLKKLRAAARMNPNDAEARKAFAVCLATMGDWKAALRELSAIPGEKGDVAKWEMAYPETGISDLTTSKVADFWWTMAEDAKEGSLTEYALRVHAVHWYKVALENGSFTGLRKTLAEKRIAEVEKPENVEGEKDEGHAGRVTVPERGTGKAPAFSRKPLSFKMAKGIEMTLMPCPAGKFDMGFAHGPEWHRPHKVTISRPFWMGKYPVTREQWGVISMVPPMSDAAKALGGMKAPVSGISFTMCMQYCEELTKKYGRVLPRGYVFRLPTDAEWEYAYRANSDPDEPYGRARGLTPQNGGAEIAVYPFMKEEILKKHKIAYDPKQMWTLPGMTVGTKKPNRWGLYDMLGNINEVMLDCFPAKLPDGYERHGGEPVQGLDYKDETDPLFWTNEEKGMHMTRGGTFSVEGWGAPKRCMPFWGGVPCVGFRIVAGPDLVREKKSGTSGRRRK